MDVEIGKRKFTLEQTWGEFKAFTKSDNALDAEVAEAQEAKDAATIEELDARRMELHEGQVCKCLRSVDNNAFDGANGLDELQFNEVAGLAIRLLQPMMEFVNRVPFDTGKPAQV